MRRIIAVGGLFVLLAYTGIYIFVYLWRAFQVDGPNEVNVTIWHGDPFSRAILVSVFFLIAVVLLGFLWLGRIMSKRESAVRVRRDLYDWLEDHAGRTGETPDELADRAVANYRERLEGVDSLSRGAPERLQA